MDVVFLDNYTKIVEKKRVQFVTDGLIVALEGKMVNEKTVEEKFMKWKGYFGDNVVVYIEDGYNRPIIILNKTVNEKITHNLTMGGYRFTSVLHGNSVILVTKKNDLFGREISRYHVSFTNGDKNVIVSKKALKKDKNAVERAFKLAGECNKTYPYIPKRAPFDAKKPSIIIVCDDGFVTEENGKVIHYDD